MMFIHVVSVGVVYSVGWVMGACYFYIINTLNLFRAPSIDLISTLDIFPNLFYFLILTKSANPRSVSVTAVSSNSH